MRVTRFTAGLLTISLGLAACGKPTVEESLDQKTIEQTAKEATAEAVTLERTPAPEGARVFFIEPADGDTLSSPITVRFGIEGMSVAKAGDNRPNSGHHHLLIDTDLPNADLPIPADANHVHFGDGSTSTEITLDPGLHTLRMLLGDYRHMPHDPPIASGPITVIVE